MAEKKKSRIFFPALAVFLAATVCFAEGLPSDDRSSAINGVYRGTIGREQIVVEIGAVPANAANENNGDTEDRITYPIRGRYFYRQHGVDIPLVGMWMGDGSLRLREYKRMIEIMDEFKAEWRLRFNDDDASGVFCKCDLTSVSTPGKPLLKISLRRISREFGGIEGSDPDLYDKLVLDFPLKDGPEIQVSPEIAYVMRSDPRFEVSRPHLTRFPDAAVMARINRDMAAELRWDRGQATVQLSQGQMQAAYGGSYGETVTVNFSLPGILSVLVGRSWYWGGAHPNYSDYAVNYDLRTGKRFDLGHAFHTANGGTGEEELATLIAKLYRRHYKKPPTIESAYDCDDLLRQIISDRETLVDWFAPTNATFFISQHGLVVIPTVVEYGYSPCGPEVTIPYKDLRPYIRKQSPLYWLVEKSS